LPPLRHREDAEELVGVLTAISVVSRRLAKKLALLERRSAVKEGDADDEPRRTITAPAD
jgi:hypothetical protein